MLNNSILLVIAAIASQPLLAHDMWIEPTTFSPESGEIVGLKLRVGQNLLGDPLARDSRLIREFIAQDATGRKPVIGRDGGNPAGFLRVAQPGLIVAGYYSNPSSVEETAEKFNQYLREEGLDAIAALRAQRKESNDPVRELFSRCAKALLLTGNPAKSDGDRMLGFALELTAERNPYILRAGEDLPLRLTFESRPLAGVLVIAINRLHRDQKISARTGTDGRVKLHLPVAGMWMVKAVHMTPAPGGTNADWQSYWASLTFELPNPGGQGNAGQ